MLDSFKVLDLLSDQERSIQRQARQLADSAILPRISEWWQNESTPTRSLMQQLGAAGFLGSTLPADYGAAAGSATSYGLICYEIERADSGIRSMLSVQSSLVIHPIYKYGSEEQKQKWLPQLIAGNLIGCFGLSEAAGGSDPAAMCTTAQRDGNNYILNGRKSWITNSPVADIAIVWAKTFDDNNEGTIRGFIVPCDSSGLSLPKIERKMSLRSAITGEIVMENCRISVDNLLPLSAGLKTPLACLTQARYGIAWGAMGALESVLQSSLDYTTARQTFNKPLAARQLVQDKLVEMASQYSLGLLLAWRLGSLLDSSGMTFRQVSLAKRNNVRTALKAARLARELHGANGITLDHHVIRHMLNLETVDTYEGTHDIHTLIVGRDLTGIAALA